MKLDELNDELGRAAFEGFYDGAPPIKWEHVGPKWYEQWTRAARSACAAMSQAPRGPVLVDGGETERCST